MGTSKGLPRALFLDNAPANSNTLLIASHPASILPAPHIGPTTPAQPPSQPHPSTSHEILEPLEAVRPKDRH